MKKISSHTKRSYPMGGRRDVYLYADGNEMVTRLNPDEYNGLLIILDTLYNKLGLNSGYYEDFIKYLKPFRIPVSIIHKKTFPKGEQEEDNWFIRFAVRKKDREHEKPYVFIDTKQKKHYYLNQDELVGFFTGAKLLGISYPKGSDVGKVGNLGAVDLALNLQNR